MKAVDFLKAFALAIGVLIVNVASQCGYTPQYAGLQALYEQYKDKGFTVLGFPCDQFGHQEPGDEQEIRVVPVSMRDKRSVMRLLCFRNSISSRKEDGHDTHIPYSG